MIPDPAQGAATTAGGFLLVFSLVVPLAGVLLAFVFGGRHVERIALGTMPLGLAIAVAIIIAMRQAGAPLVYLLGGWAPPLGVALRADGRSAAMMAITAVVITAIGVFARADFTTPAGVIESRAPFSFWILLLAIWAALNAIFLGGDFFTLYVALELLTFAAVPMVSLDGRAETLRAALRYLLFALLGSAFYLAGTVLLYGVYGTLDIALLSQRVQAEPAILIAGALMTAGLLAKTALFPLHMWLPPAHAGAPAAASAVLSALVVKGSFFLIVRLWFDAMPKLPGIASMDLLAALGAAAIVFGSVVALRQERLKLLVAYSTVAQIGYLFLMFPLAFDAGASQMRSGVALAAGMLQVMSHATAKAAMFMAAGLIYASIGSDRIAGLAGVARALPISVLAFALAGVALIGVPPSGAYLAKELMLQAATQTEQWWWAITVQAGGIFTSGYVLLVLVHALAPADQTVILRVPASRIGEASALMLALCSLLLGLAPWEELLSASAGARSASFSLLGLSRALWPILAGGVLAVLLGRWGLPSRAPFGKVIVAIGDASRCATLCQWSERVDGTLQQWPAATLSLLIVTIVLGAMLFAGR